MAKKRKNSNYVGSKSYNERERAKREKAAAAAKKRLTVIVSLILILISVIAVPVSIVAGVNEYKTNQMGTGYADDTLMKRDISKRNVKYAEFTVEKYGKFVVLLDATAAPKTVTNFVNLANEGFYDGLTFHRVLDSMIQGGDPLGNGTGGYTDENGKEVTIVDEFYSNIKHMKGTISMANSNNSETGRKNTASSQFFICTKTNSSWDYNYASFGYVVEGMSVVEAVNAAMLKKADSDDTLKSSKQPVIRSVKILDDYNFEYNK